MIVPEPGFVDTNVFIYANSTQNLQKSSAAQDLIGSLVEHKLLVTSTQVLQELYVNLTKKSVWRREHTDVLQLLAALREWPVVSIDPEMIHAAAQLKVEDSISFWDALIVIAANHAGASRLYTEDLNHGRKIFGVEVVNPFLACM